MSNVELKKCFNCGYQWNQYISSHVLTNANRCPNCGNFYTITKTTQKHEL